jgi:hypothetical protein
VAGRLLAGWFERARILSQFYAAFRHLFCLALTSPPGIDAPGVFGVALVHRIHSQIPGTPSWIGTAALANGHQGGPGFLVILEALACYGLG